MSDSALIPAPEIQQRIHFVRGKRVLLDADLARFYGVTTFNLNKAVARNPDRFPDDFAFRLTLEESRALIFQSGISRPGRGGTRKAGDNLYRAARCDGLRLCPIPLLSSEALGLAAHSFRS